MSSVVLRVEKLRKSFGDEVVLQDITFSVPEHTATVFIGSSGSGKSTLLRLRRNICETIFRITNSRLNGQKVFEVEPKTKRVFEKRLS